MELLRTTGEEMPYAIKAMLSDPQAETFVFVAQKTMYGGKNIASGDTVFIFGREKEGAPGLVARGAVEAVQPAPRLRGVPRQTPRVSVTVRRTASVKHPLGRNELKRFTDWNDGRPETELNFKFYRQATDKIAGISDGAAAFLNGYF